MASPTGSLVRLLLHLALTFWIHTTFFTRAQARVEVVPLEEAPEIPSNYKSDYSRVPEAQKQCPFPSSFAAAAADEQGPDPKWVIQNELSFRNGDWFQQPGSKSHLLAFSDSENPTLLPFQLASFWITDVNLRGRSGIVKISAVLELAITNKRSVNYLFRNAAESSEADDGFSLSTMLLEGVYFESGTERGVCMVGCRAVSPSSSKSCDIYLQLHYPLRLSLLSREVHGFLQSTEKNSAANFFDRVAIASQLGAYSTYDFSSEDVLKPACSPLQQQMPPKGIQVYKKNRFCSVLMQILSGNLIRLSGSKNASSMQALDIRCIDQDNPKTSAKVSVVFRAVSKNRSLRLSIGRTALRSEQGLALATEGIFNSETGELCMLGCYNSSKSSCRVRASAFFPITFSIRQRNVLIGRFSSLNPEEQDHGFAGAKFQMFALAKTLPRELSSELRYNYTRIEEAAAKAKQDESQTSLKERIKSSLLKFPGSGDEDLGRDLTVDSPLTGVDHRSSLELEVLRVEDEAVSWSSWFSVKNESRHSGDESQRGIRVAVQISVSGQNNDSISGEGVYSPRTGKMHLLGCRIPSMIDSSSEVDSATQDCGVTVVVDYPPKNTQWLVSPTVIMKISSSSGETTKLQTFPILYRGQLQEILSRKTLEAFLSALTLSLMIVCILLQLRHVNKSRESAPFVSLLMLAVHAFGYSIPLITGAEALFARLTRSSSSSSSEMESIGGHLQVSDVILYLVKLLSLAAFLLMLRLCQRVIRARIRLSTRFPLEPRRVPSEWKTLKLFAVLHVLGFLAVLGFHYLFRSFSNEYMFSSASVVGWDGQQQIQEGDLIKELKEYAGLVEDLFLLPQVIAGWMWEIKGEPLRAGFYVGITILRLLPHAYSALSDPLFNPFYADEASVFANPRLDFYSRAGDSVIPLLAMVLAWLVYAQQRWKKGFRLEVLLRQGSSKLMRYGSKLYRRLPSGLGSAEVEGEKNFEAEMMMQNA